ncbi:hypothetical protein Dimus_038513 [Dionaea muscipula]
MWSVSESTAGGCRTVSEARRRRRRCRLRVVQPRSVEKTERGSGLGLSELGETLSELGETLLESGGGLASLGSDRRWRRVRPSPMGVGQNPASSFGILFSSLNSKISLIEGYNYVCSYA